MNPAGIQLIAEILQHAETQGKSQKDLSRETGLSEAVISRAKTTGEYRISTAATLAKAVGLRLTVAADHPIAALIESGGLFKS